MRYAVQRYEHGMALITSLLILLMITVLGLCLFFLGHTAQIMATNRQETTEAFFIADAGAVHAAELVLASSNYNNILTAGDGTEGTGDELSTQAIDPIAAGGEAFGNGRYVVSVSRDANQHLIITSTGFGRNGATAIVEVTITGAATLAPALLINGKLKITGTPQVTGSAGVFAHTNDTLEFTNKACAEGYFSTTPASFINGNKALTGAGCTGNDMRASQPFIAPPIVNVSSLRNSVDYILGNDGNVYTPLSSSIVASNSFNGWVWNASSKLWTVSNTTLTPASYYAEGSMKITGSPGKDVSPLPSVSLIAAGSIEITGSPSFQPRLTFNGTKYSMAAGTDMKISGSGIIGDPNNQGLVYVHDQLNIPSGSWVVNGQIIAADLADNPTPGGNNLVSAGTMSFSGSPTINYTGGGSGSGSGARISGWREVRN